MGRIDSDLWAQQATLSLVAAYLDPEWRQYLRLSGDRSVGGIDRRARETGFSGSLPETGLWRPGSALRAAGEHDDPMALTSAYLDREGLDCAVLNPGVAAALSAVGSPYYAAAVAKAVNDWTSSAWLDADPRFRGSIVVSSVDAALAAAEVERLASNGRMVQILFAYPRRLLGHRRALEPLFEVASSSGLPINLQSGGAFAGGNRGVAAVGHPTSVFEYELEWIAGAQAHLISMICEGTFERHPRLRLVLSGFGAAWLPSLVWRMDAEFRSGRVKAPVAVKRLPSEYVRDHVRVTTSPLEAPQRPGDFEALMAMIGGERLLLFGSGPARGEEHVYTAVLDSLPEQWRHHIFHENASAIYRGTTATSCKASATESS